MKMIRLRYSGSSDPVMILRVDWVPIPRGSSTVSRFIYSISPPQQWSDYKMVWDPREYGGIDRIRLPSGTLWKPDVLLFNRFTFPDKLLYFCDIFTKKVPTKILIPDSMSTLWSTMTEASCRHRRPSSSPPVASTSHGNRVL